MHQFRYSRSQFLTMMIASLALTAAITFTAYVLLSTFGVRQYKLFTYATGLIFFGFLSAGMIYRFLRKEVVLSIHQGGILDVRHSPEVVAWNDIRRIVLERVEREEKLRVWTWPHLGPQQGPHPGRIASNGRVSFVIDLSLLDGDTETIIRSVERYCPVERTLFAATNAINNGNWR